MKLSRPRGLSFMLALSLAARSTSALLIEACQHAPNGTLNGTTKWHHKMAPPDLAPDVLVIGFSSAKATSTCQKLQPLRCVQWPGIRLSSFDSACVRAAVDARLIASPGGGLGNCGAALAHISAWELVASAPSRHRATLIIEEDELVSCPEVVRTLLRERHFPYDIFYLNARRPFGRADPTPPDERVYRIVPHELAAGADENNLWTSAYVVQPLQLLRAATPDISTRLLDSWLSMQTRAGKLDAFVWNRSNDIFAHAFPLKSDRQSSNDRVGSLMKLVLSVGEALHARAPEPSIGSCKIFIGSSSGRQQQRSR